MRNLMLAIGVMLYSVCGYTQAIVTWSVGNVTVDCEMAQICYPIMVQTTEINTQLSFTTLRFLYDPALMNMLEIAEVENGYIATLDLETSPTVGVEFGFSTAAANFPRISISPNIANYLTIMVGVPTHVYTMCFDLLVDPIPDELCSPLVIDYNHTALPGIANDAGYFVGDAGIATQYVFNGTGGAIAADDEAIQFLWMGNPSFDGVLNTPGEIVGFVATVGCIVTDCSPLAVGLLDFIAYKKDREVLLQWSTSFELQNDYFEVQRSTGGSGFVVIGKVDAATDSGLQYYAFTDSNPGDGVNYYRLRQVDTDGEASFSQVRTVVFDQSVGFRIMIAPNPVANLLMLNFSSANAEEYTYHVYITNLAGQRVQKIDIHGAGSVNKEVDVSQLPSGLYMVEVWNNTGIIHVEKLVKQQL